MDGVEDERGKGEPEHGAIDEAPGALAERGAGGDDGERLTGEDAGGDGEAELEEERRGGEGGGREGGGGPRRAERREDDVDGGEDGESHAGGHVARRKGGGERQRDQNPGCAALCSPCRGGPHARSLFARFAGAAGGAACWHERTAVRGGREYVEVHRTARFAAY